MSLNFPGMPSMMKDGKRCPGGYFTEHDIDHPNRCVAVAKSTGERCKHWAIAGVSHCRTHGGHGGKGRIKRYSKLRYSRYLGRSLIERVEAIREEDSPVQSLKDELELMRALACDSLALHQAAETVEDPDKRQALMRKASEYVTNALKEVRDMAMAMARVEREAGARIDIVAVNNIIGKVVVVLTEELKVLGDDNRDMILQRVKMRINDEVVVNDGTMGTTVTPDQDVRDMISTIPRE